MSDDPLQDILDLQSTEAQIAVIVSVLRSTRSTQVELRRKMDWMLRALWSMVASIVIGIIVFQVNATSSRRPADPAGVHSTSSSSRTAVAVP